MARVFNKKHRRFLPRHSGQGISHPRPKLVPKQIDITAEFNNEVRRLNQLQRRLESRGYTFEKPLASRSKNITQKELDRMKSITGKTVYKRASHYDPYSGLNISGTKYRNEIEKPYQSGKRVVAGKERMHRYWNERREKEQWKLRGYNYNPETGEVTSIDAQTTNVDMSIYDSILQKISEVPDLIWGRTSSGDRASFDKTHYKEQMVTALNNQIREHRNNGTLQEYLDYLSSINGELDRAIIEVGDSKDDNVVIGGAGRFIALVQQEVMSQTQAESLNE